MKDLNESDLPAAPPRANRLWIGVIPLLLILWAIGVHEIAGDSLWYDEVWSTYYAGGSFYGPVSPAETVQRVVDESQHEKNPPGYYVLLNLWWRAAGWSEFTGKMLSIFAGMAAVAAAYRLGRDGLPLSARSRDIAGLGTAAALGGSAFFLYYTQELRAYVFVVLLAALGVWLYLRMIDSRREPGWRMQGAFVLILALMVYCHYTTLVIGAALLIYHLGQYRRHSPQNRRWWRMLLLMALSGVLFLPWLGMLLSSTAKASSDLRTVALPAGKLLKTLAYAFSSGYLPLAALLALQAARPYARRAWMLAASAILLILALNLALHVVTHIRYAIVVFPLLAWLVGLGIERLWRYGVWAGWPLLILLAGGVWNSVTPGYLASLHDMYNGNTMPWNRFTAELRAHSQPGDLVMFHSPVVVWMQGKELAYYMHPFPNRADLLEAIPGLQANDEYFHNAAAFIGRAPRVWLGVDQTQAPNFRLAEFQRALAPDYAHCATAFDTKAMRLDLYARPPEPAALAFDPGAQVSLVEPLRVESGGKLRVVLDMVLADSITRGDYSMGLHVLDAQGTLRAQIDRALPADAHTCRVESINVSRLPPGTYTLGMAIYNWQTGERWTGHITADGKSADWLPLGTFIKK